MYSAIWVIQRALSVEVLGMKSVNSPSHEEVRGPLKMAAQDGRMGVRAVFPRGSLMET